MTTSHDELTIDELLHDPVTRALMKADRVDASALEAMLRALAPRIVHPAGRSNLDSLDVEHAPFDRNAVSRFLRSMDRGRSAPPRRLPARSGLLSQLCGAP